MARHIAAPTIMCAAGDPPKQIEELVGRVNSGTEIVSIARMVSPQGWSEPGQTPSFDEMTVVLDGALHVATRDAFHVVRAGQAIIVNRGEWVQYSAPEQDGAIYIAVCVPAFSPDTVCRDTQP